MQLKKYRKKAQSFLVEGAKSVQELLDSSYEITHLLVTEAFLVENDKSMQMLGDRVSVVNEKQLTAASAFKTNQMALAVAVCQSNRAFEIGKKEYVIALDRIRDPGNLGTIIRIADWYGIRKILCSADCADFYHPKVIQASMGSFTRVLAYYTQLETVLKSMSNIYGATLKGESVHQTKFTEGGILLIGNESQGLSEPLLKLVDGKISIPGYGRADSLNAAVATAVICDNIRRSQA